LHLQPAREVQLQIAVTKELDKKKAFHMKGRRELLKNVLLLDLPKSNQRPIPFVSVAFGFR
jgi:hypothetical protein